MSSVYETRGGSTGKGVLSYIYSRVSVSTLLFFVAADVDVELTIKPEYDIELMHAEGVLTA